MVRLLVVAIVASVFSNTAFGHFVFVVPQKDGKTIHVVMSESLVPDEGVILGPVATLKLLARGVDGKDAPIALAPHDHHLAGNVASQHVVFGSLDYGVASRGDLSFMLKYHPKSILGSMPAKHHQLQLPDGVGEIVPERADGGIRFRVMFGKAPAAKASVTVLNPDGSEKKVETDADGRTPVFSASGRYGAWARIMEEKSGEHQGKKYAQIRHYPTLVFDFSLYPPLPEAVSSLGAAVDKEWVYVYGGHRAKVHSYNTTAVTGAWQRLNLAKPTGWEALPTGAPLQGLALVAYNGKLIRIGGMAPHNQPGTPADMRSTDSCAIYDPATKVWQPFPALPKPRSSHDASVVGDKLIVVGGWNMRGSEESEWFEDALILDLREPGQGWKSSRQPFQRRALQTAAFQNRVYVAGGLDDEDSIVGAVSIFDPATNTWSEAPQLPGGKKVGFNPGICMANDRLYVSVADGTVARLSLDGKSWETITKVAPRIVHRMVPAGDHGLLLIGGASKGDNLESVEVVPLGKK